MNPQRKAQIKQWSEVGGDLRSSVEFVEELLTEVAVLESQLHRAKEIIGDLAKIVEMKEPEIQFFVNLVEMLKERK